MFRPNSDVTAEAWRTAARYEAVAASSLILTVRSAMAVHLLGRAMWGRSPLPGADLRSGWEPVVRGLLLGGCDGTVGLRARVADGDVGVPVVPPLGPHRLVLAVPADAAQVPVAHPVEEPGEVLFGPLRVVLGDRLDEPPEPVVAVPGDGSAGPAEEDRPGDGAAAVPVGGVA